MVGLYVFSGLVVVGIVVLIVFKIKWARTGRAVIRGRREKIEEERIERERIESRSKE